MKKNFLEVTWLEIEGIIDPATGHAAHCLYFKDAEEKKWYWNGDNIFLADQSKGQIIQGDLSNAELIHRAVSRCIGMKKGGQSTIDNYRKQVDELLSELKQVCGENDKLRLGYKKSSIPFKISKDHYNDLLTTISTSPEKQEKFRKMKLDPGFFIIEHPAEGEYLQDLTKYFIDANMTIEPGAEEEIDTSCDACRNTIKDWNGSDARCGFTSGVFDGLNNWRCGTVRQVRELAERFGGLLPGISYYSAEDQHYSTIPTAHIKEFQDDPYATPLCLWIGWYKSRGRTEGMWLIYENIPPRPPTEQECLLIIKKYATHLQRNLDNHSFEDHPE